MQFKAITTFTFLFFFSFSFAQSGKVYDQLSLKSEILKMDRNYAIYLPPDYESSNRSYPVLYLLHGAGDDQTGWVQFGEVLHITDKAISQGHATPMIIVMPDANTKRKGYFNSINGEWLYEDFFFQELMPYVEKTYRIKAEKRYRAIAGLSMGGGGTTIYAMHHPELFIAACPLSAAMRNSTIDDFVKKYNPDVDNGSEREKVAYYKRYNAHAFLEETSVEAIKTVDWYFDCGDDDFLYEGNSLMHISLRKKDVPHEFRIRDGAHSWTYWRESLPDVLHFVSERFHQH